MATDAIEIRMARLEGAYEQINERLGALEQRLSSEIATLRSEVRADLAALRSEVLDHRRQTTGQFYWMLTFILGSILIPILRDFAR